MYDEQFSRNIIAYLDLMARRPELFPMKDTLICDQEELETFARNNSKQVGLIYESHWHYLLVDVVAGKDGRPAFAYERYIPVTSDAGGVAVPMLPDGRICLLENYRHMLGKVVLELPRGSASGKETGKQAAIRELAEELGAESISCTVLGSVIADSGVSGTPVAIAMININETNARIDHEGIKGIRIMSPAELDYAIADGKIQDAFTLSAIAMMKATRLM